MPSCRVRGQIQPKGRPTLIQLRPDLDTTPRRPQYNFTRTLIKVGADLPVTSPGLGSKSGVTLIQVRADFDTTPTGLLIQAGVALRRGEVTPGGTKTVPSLVPSGSCSTQNKTFYWDNQDTLWFRTRPTLGAIKTPFGANQDLPSLEPYFRADQIFTSVPGLSVEGQSKVETDNQVVAALRAGEKARLILFSGTGLLLLAVSCYGYRQTKKPPKAEPSGGGNPTTIRRP